MSGFLINRCKQPRDQKFALYSCRFKGCVFSFSCPSLFSRLPTKQIFSILLPFIRKVFSIERHSIFPMLCSKAISAAQSSISSYILISLALGLLVPPRRAIVLLFGGFSTASLFLNSSSVRCIISSTTHSFASCKQACKRSHMQQL